MHGCVAALGANLSLQLNVYLQPTASLWNRYNRNMRQGTIYPLVFTASTVAVTQADADNLIESVYYPVQIVNTIMVLAIVVGAVCLVGVAYAVYRRRAVGSGYATL